MGFWCCFHCLYPTAMSDENSIHPRRETGYAFTKDMNDELVKKTKEGNFTQVSAILTTKFII